MTPVTPSFNVGITVPLGDETHPPQSSYWDDVDVGETKSKRDMCQENQEAIVITSNGDNSFTVEVPNDLNTWKSSVQDPNTKHAWIVLGIDTNTDNIKQVKYGDYTFTDADIAEAVEWNLEAGYFVLWIPADNSSLKTFVLKSVDGSKEDTNVTVSVVVK